MCAFDFTLVCFQTVEWCLTTPIVPARTLHAQLSKTSRRTLPNRARKLQEGRPLLRCRNERNDSRYQTRNDFLLRRITLNRAAAVSFARRFETEARLGPRGASWRRLAICSVCHAGATYLPRRVCEGIQHVCVGIRRQPKCCCRRSFGRSVGLSGNAGVHGFSSFSHF